MVHFPRMDTRIARRLMHKKKRLDAYGPLPPLTVERIHEDLRVLLTYHSNAIEGNTLPLAETQIVLAYGITVNEHPCSFIEGKRGAITSSAREMCISRAIPLAHLHQWDPTGLLPTQMGMAID